MGLKILFICFISYLNHKQNDLSQFLYAVGGKIVHVKSFYSIIEQVKCEPVTECPGIVIAVFSTKDEQLALNASMRYEATQYERFHACKTCTVCFLVNKKVYVYKGATGRNHTANLNK